MALGRRYAWDVFLLCYDPGAFVAFVDSYLLSISVVVQDSLNPDPDPSFKVSPDPDPGF
jgi:hypothetical protein